MNGDPRIGTEIGGYRIDALIGRGASGGVYVAEQLRLGRKVALKILSPELAADTGFRQRFVRESHLAAEIEHPGIVPIYDAGDEAGTLFMSMRLVEGSDLASELAGGRMEPERCVRLLTQVAEALDAAHARGLVHRDVKPANILLAAGPGSSERAYLSDFGIAKRSGSLPELTQTGHFVGTVDYVAPEQIRGEDIDGRADQYSLACVLYHCVTGEPPFPRPTAVAVIYAHLNDDPPRPSERRADLRPGLDPVVLRGLAKARDDRFESCTALATAADAAMRGRVTTGVVGAAAPPVGHRRRSRRRRWLPVVVATGVALLLAASTVALLVLPSGRDLNDPPDGRQSPSPSVADLIWTEVGEAALRGRGNLVIHRAIVIPSGIVAVGYEEIDGDRNVAIWSSPDGEGWDRATSRSLEGEGDQTATGIARSGDTLVAVGFDSSGGDKDAAIWLSSDDGSSWTQAPSTPDLAGPGDQEMSRVVEVGGELVAIGFDEASRGDQEIAVWSSTDAQNWFRAETRVFADTQAQEARSVAVFEGDPFAVGSETLDDDQDAAVWRLGAEHWVQSDDPDLHRAGNQGMKEVVAGGPGLVAVGVDENAGSTDAAVWIFDGDRWSWVDDPSLGGEGDQVMLGVAVVGSELVAVGTEQNGGRLDGAIWISSDGATWDRVSTESRSVTALGQAGKQYVIEVLPFGDGVAAFGRIGRFDRSNAAVWLALPDDA